MQMLMSLQAYKACQSTMPSHPIKGFMCVEDWFETSLVRSKPFIESIVQKKRKKMTQEKTEADQGVRAEPLPLLLCKKRVSLQSGLDSQAYVEESD